MWTVYLANNMTIREDSCNWDRLPWFPIVKLEYLLPNKKRLVLTGFEKYLVKREEYHLFQGGKGLGKIIDTYNIMGKTGKKVYQISLHRKGKVAQIINEWGREFRPLTLFPLPKKNGKKQYKIEFGKPRQTNHDLWHFGVKCSQSKVEII